MRPLILRPSGNSQIMSALKRFKLERDPVTRKWHPRLPADFQTVHAVADVSSIQRSPERAKDPYFLEGPNEYKPALCGAKVKVVLAIPFNGGEPRACNPCAQILKEAKKVLLANQKTSLQAEKLANNYKSVKL